MAPQDVSRDLFERRMRQRRAATCVVAARASMADGRTPEAVERLEEACRLDPEALEARLLLEQIRADEPADLPELVPGAAASAEAGFGGWSHWVAAAIAVGALAALALLRQPGTDESRATPTRERARPAIGAEARTAAQAAPEAGLPETPPGSADTVPLVIEPAEAPSIFASAEPSAPPVSTDGRGGAVGTGGSAAAPQRTVSDPPATARPAPAGGAAADVPGGTVATTAAGAIPLGARAVDVGGASGAPLAPPPVERPAVTGAGGEPPRVAGDTTRTTDIAASQAGAPTTAAPHASQTQAAAANSTAPASPLVPAGGPPLPAAEDASRVTPAARAADPTPASYRARDEEEEIGRTLQGYADAYTRLDASAARKVWPTVDERALARAFAGLQSQGIFFERCETEVNGSEASAVCRGRAKYVPKVGSREPLTASRQWTFRLRRAGDGWQIARADVR